MNKILSSQEILMKLTEKQYKQQSSYYLMYSSWFGGYVKDPGLMLVPIDDHQVHRGDAIFEAIKVIDKKVYLLGPHLERLQKSAASIGLALDSINGISGVRKIVLEALQIANVSEALIRIFVSRGPGGFTTNPYDSVGTQLYVVITQFVPVADAKYQSGVSIGRSQFPAKESWMATVKSCNYLPNVMMKKEAVDRGLDFTVSFDGNAKLAESSTENIIIFTKDGKLLRPKGHQILKGTMMTRALELAESLVGQGLIKEVCEADITEEMLLSAQEVMMVGTTLDVLPVKSYEGKEIGTDPSLKSSERYKVANMLCQLLRVDMKKGPFAESF